MVINCGLHGVVDIFIPVSYTHLDVYKRQLLGKSHPLKYVKIRKVISKLPFIESLLLFRVFAKWRFCCI